MIMLVEVEDTGDTACTVQSELSLTRGHRTVNNTLSLRRPGHPAPVAVKHKQDHLYHLASRHITPHPSYNSFSQTWVVNDRALIMQ